MLWLACYIYIYIYIVFWWIFRSDKKRSAKAAGP
jgi:hypothetical protein